MNNTPEDLQEKIERYNMCTRIIEEFKFNPRRAGGGGEEIRE